jgi:diguanylate cyclase (GGDEF)-like protein
MTDSHEIKVLLVENHPDEAGLMQGVSEETELKRFSFHQENVFQRAVDHLRENSFDVVLLDLSLPDVKGVDSIRTIHSEFPYLPIVAFSKVSDEQVVVQAIKAGAQDCLVKGQGDGNLLARSLRYAIERKQAEERLAYLAQYDHLTGLANRTLFKDRLTQALARADRNDQQVALMFLDLDNFKVVNDTLGHDAGDIVLRAVAERLKKCVRVTDTVARLGGDEFIIILDGLPKSDVPVIVAQKIINALAPPFHISDREVFITTSIGISRYPMDAKNAKDLLKYADRSMYLAKEKGCSNYQFYAAEINLRATERLTFRSGLYHALDRDELVLHYQPIVNLRSGRIIGLEALLRWHLPNYGLLYPDRFIDLAEETELIVPIGEWVMRKACESVHKWLQSYPRHFRISVNLSARQFRQRELFSNIKSILLDSGLEPGRLELELTEGTLMEQTEISSSTLMNLKDLGVRISIDDFGTGYSSLSYLRKFPIDTLKIAQTFVKDLTNNSDDAAISKAIIAMAHSLRLEVIAEGVETMDQLSILFAQGCDAAQGYYLGKPIGEEDIPALLMKGSLLESTESPDDKTQPGLKRPKRKDPVRKIA